MYTVHCTVHILSPEVGTETMKTKKALMLLILYFKRFKIQSFNTSMLKNFSHKSVKMHEATAM